MHNHRRKIHLLNTKEGSVLENTTWVASRESKSHGTAQRWRCCHRETMLGPLYSERVAHRLAAQTGQLLWDHPRPLTPGLLHCLFPDSGVSFQAAFDTENMEFPLCLTINDINIEGISTL